MQAKEALIRAHAFPRLPVFQKTEYQPRKRHAHLLVTKDMIQKVLFCQSIKKTPRPNLHYFLILCLLWDWKVDRIISLTMQALRLHYHPKKWKHTRGFLIKKPNKRDCILIKSYQVISLIKLLG